MKTTGYFEKTVRVRRPYLKDEWIKQVLRDPLRTEVQANGRVRRCAYIHEASRYLRVVTEPDAEPYTMPYAGVPGSPLQAVT